MIAESFSAERTEMKLTELGEYMRLGDPAGWVILDTETCGLDTDAHVCQIGCIELASGEVIIDELVNPGRPIPARATAVHGITDDMVVLSLNVCAVLSRLKLHLDRTGQRVITWNAAFDSDAMVLSLEKDPGCEDCRRLRAAIDWRWRCAMNADMELRDADRWRRLPGAGHRAIDDCRAVRALLVETPAPLSDPEPTEPVSHDPTFAARWMEWKKRNDR
jgi:DNA polymerase III epsilon subunit-like protein